MKIKKFPSSFELSPTLQANEMAAAARARGEYVWHMGFGQSPFPVPERLKEALASAATQKDYLPTSGLDRLKDTVKAYYEKRTGIKGDDYDVIVSPGSKLILYALQDAVPGDLLHCVPSWVSYAPQARMLGTNVIDVNTMLDDKGFHISAESLENAITDAKAQGLNPTKIILNSPNNPTGLKIPESTLAEIAPVIKKHDILVIWDEIYGFVDFDDNYYNITKYLPDNTVISTGLSKHLSLGGWRIGIGFIPKSISKLFPYLCQFASETWSCVAAPVQEACIEAYLEHEDIENHIVDCTRIHGYMNRYLARGLRNHNVDIPIPQGAFYSYPNFKNYKDFFASKGVHSSRDLSAYFMKEGNMLTLPGEAFGEPADNLTLRLSGVDYDGTEVLTAYQNGAELNDDFVLRHAPRIAQAVEKFGKLLDQG